MAAESNAKTKAGKKSGGYTPPPAAKPENQDARLLGEKQFIGKDRPAPVPTGNGSGWEAGLDALCRQFGVKRIRRNQNYDTGLRYDEARKRYIAPPGREK